MKKIFASVALVIFAFFSLGVSPFVRTDGESQVQGPLRVYEDIYNHKNSIDQLVTTETTDNITLYVRSTGADTNTCLTVGDACLTIQEAIDRIPKSIGHNVLVDVGPGSFAGFYLTGFNLTFPNGQLEISGDLGNHTPGTGTGSGTADGGSTLQCADSGQTWTVDALIGKMVLVDGEYRFIRDNDATSIDLVGPLQATCNGKAYQLIQHDTVLDTFPPNNVYAYIEGYGITASGPPTSGLIWVTDFATDGQSGWYDTWWFYNTASVSVARIFGDEAYYGGGWQNVYGVSRAEDIWLEDGAAWAMFYILHSDHLRAYRVMAKRGGGSGVIAEAITFFRSNYFYAEDNVADGISFYNIGTYVTVSGYLRSVGNGGYGVALYNCGNMNFDEVYLEGNTKSGLYVGTGCKWVDLDSGTIENNSEYGIQMGEDTSSPRSAMAFLDAGGTITVQNNTLGGVRLENHSIIRLAGMTGTNTGAYGLSLTSRSHASVTSATAVTGATGNATMDEGTTILTWATDFANDGDVVTNLSNFCRIERKD
ncbi:MAG: hypothetical protein AM326_03375 [Candidatus Thorarchaeota archaeon SMTZ-45]|nr:MAG: hypothetical protein AM326_03375 [Candidatus Thorarchaeota archaeon SMTZ-45]